MEVKEEAEENFAREVDRKLVGSVFSAGCSNWYINTAGRNSASWPGKAANYWGATLFPKWGDYVYSGGDALGFLRSLYREVKNAAVSKVGAVGTMAALLVLLRKQAITGDGVGMLDVSKLRDFASSSASLFSLLKA
jgi:hypothetical protein